MQLFENILLCFQNCDNMQGGSDYNLLLIGSDALSNKSLYPKWCSVRPRSCPAAIGKKYA